MHTPGPWSVEEYGDDDAPALVIHKDSQTRVCFMATPGSHGDPAKIEADANLIAAAPDLLEALKNFLAWLKSPPINPHNIADYREDAERAIAKAEKTA